MNNETLKISETIFYSPATNNKAEASILNGAKLIQAYADQEAASLKSDLAEETRLREMYQGMTEKDSQDIVSLGENVNTMAENVRLMREENERLKTLLRATIHPLDHKKYNL